MVITTWNQQKSEQCLERLREQARARKNWLPVSALPLTDHGNFSEFLFLVYLPSTDLEGYFGDHKESSFNLVGIQQMVDRIAAVSGELSAHCFPYE